MKKKILYYSAAALFGGGMLLGVLFAGKTQIAHNILGSSDEVWNHYTGVDATLEKKGIKEYWVNCTTHESVFSAPASDHIVDMGAPSESFINSLPDNDPRLLARYLKGIDCVFQPIRKERRPCPGGRRQHLGEG